MNNKKPLSHPFLKIQGGRRLQGAIEVSGAKNASLPLLFACLLAEGRHVFHNVPQLKDVSLALKMLSSLGLQIERNKGVLKIENQGPKAFAPCPESAKDFRAGVLCLGPLLAVLGQVKVPLPGGCDIGARPIDLHLKGLSLMGAEFRLEKGFVIGKTGSQGLKGARVVLPFPSVGATENLIMAGVCAQGSVRLENIACEPEIEDLIRWLKLRGARIRPLGARELEIEGVSRLKPVQTAHTVIPDRIEAGTLLLAGAVTRGNVRLKKCQPRHLSLPLAKLKEAGFAIEAGKEEIALKAIEKAPSGLHISTGVYPGFPTDLQAQFMVLMTRLFGLSSLEETIFENRFRYIQQLNRLGAGIQIKGRKAFVQGPVALKGAKMLAGDLRAGAGLALAGLSAEGESQIEGLHHIERGYEGLPFKLKSLGADIALCQNPS